MNDRETKQITLPVSQAIVELYAYLIGREKRALTNVFLGKNLSVSMEGAIAGIDSASLEAAEELAWKTVIASINGHKEGDTIEGVDKPFSVVDFILDLRVEDYDFICNAVNEVKQDADFGKKKTD